MRRVADLGTLDAIAVALKDTTTDRAFHEAGHAIAFAVLGIPFTHLELTGPHGSRVATAAIERIKNAFPPDRGVAAARTVEWEEGLEDLWLRDMVARVCGPIAQRKYHREDPTQNVADLWDYGGSGDCDFAKREALAIACRREADDHEAVVKMKNGVADAIACGNRLISDHWESVVALAERLKQENGVEAAEVRGLIKPVEPGESYMPKVEGGGSSV